jgi:DNA sulfur modification protein DndB
MASAFTLTVPATRGQMGETLYYTANFPMGMVVKLFKYNPDDMARLDVEDRHQRALKKARIPEIADYIVDNEDYIFSSITVSVDSTNLVFRSSEVDPDVGLLEIPMEAEWVVNDGQHRVAGIAQALSRHPERETDKLSVVILPDGGLQRSQQIFSDLNRTVQKTSKSLDILFDHRVPLNRITNAVVERVRLFKGNTDKERVSLAARSADFATLSGVEAANKQLLADIAKVDKDDEYQRLEDLAVDFWEYVSGIVEPWPDLIAGRTRPADARSQYISSYALALFAIASAGHTAIAAGGDWKRRLDDLRNIDWTKDNPDWQSICMQGSEVVTRSTTRKATADYVRWKIGLGPRPTGQAV